MIHLRIKLIINIFINEYTLYTLIARNLKTLEKALSSKKLKKKDIGLVPTMGAIHNGHLALVDKSLKYTSYNCNYFY